jgi:hypothetical protein
MGGLSALLCDGATWGSLVPLWAASCDLEACFRGGSGTIRQYRIYVWRWLTSDEPEIVQMVEATSADVAIQLVLRSRQVAYAFYVWVVPLDEELPCLDRYRVRCAGVRTGMHCRKKGEAYVV